MGEVDWGLIRLGNEEQGEKWIKHYCNSHSILLVGEGDFSFSACLAKAFGYAHNMVATSLDSRGDVIRKHPTAEANLEELERKLCLVLHGVNAHYMSEHPSLKTRKFDRIVFNFPHACCEGLEHYLIDLHQVVVKGFFQSARAMLTGSGEVHVTHKTVYPFSKWMIEVLAKEVGLSLVEPVGFSLLDYPGYKNKRGYGQRSNDSFPVADAYTFKFRRSENHIDTFNIL